MNKKDKWIVLSEKKGRVQLTSRIKDTKPGLLPAGSFLTITDGNTKFIIRVVESGQFESYSPSPLVVDLDLGEFSADQACQNIINAVRVKNISKRNDGLIDFIKPQLLARKSTQDEVDSALGVDRSEVKGPTIFLTSIQYSENKILTDDTNTYLNTVLPEDLFYHQIMVTGKTGSGKTVAAKYLTQYFSENFDGAVIAINVKDDDLLTMNNKSNAFNKNIANEWSALNSKPHGIDNYHIFYPANNTTFRNNQNIDLKIASPITLNVEDIEPTALTGLLQNISDIGAQNLPGIFNYWRENNSNNTFNGFISFMTDGAESYDFRTLDSRGEISTITLHRGTYDNIMRSLNYAREFFDYDNAINITVDDVLNKGQFSAIDVAGGDKGITFGSVILRHLLRKIVLTKRENKSNIPVLLFIDEVHQFYGDNASKEALSDLDTICRTGRSQKIGVIFASQNPKDIPRGLESVINTKLYFRSDDLSGIGRNYSLSNEDINTLKPGFGFGTIFGCPGVKTFKVPLALASIKG